MKNNSLHSKHTSQWADPKLCRFPLGTDAIIPSVAFLIPLSGAGKFYSFLYFGIKVVPKIGFWMFC